MRTNPLTLIPNEPEAKEGLGDCRSGTALSSLRDGAELHRLHPPGFNRISQGPSERFVKLTRDPDLPRPVRFEPTTKREGDIVL